MITMVLAAADPPPGLNVDQFLAVGGLVVAAVGALGIWLDRRGRVRDARSEEARREIENAAGQVRSLAQERFVANADHLQLVERVTRLEARQEMALEILREAVSGRRRWGRPRL